MKPDKFKLEQIGATLAGMVGCAAVVVYSTLNPAPNDFQAIAHLHFHPIITLVAPLFPALVLAPFAYWMVGRLLRRRLLHSRSNDLIWQTFLENDPGVGEAVERLCSFSPKNIEEFRVLLLRHRDCTRAKEFEDEAIRRIQGPAFVGDTALREAYIILNREDARLGDELVRAIGVIGKPKDLERTVGQVRKTFTAKRKLEQNAHSETFGLKLYAPVAANHRTRWWRHGTLWVVALAMFAGAFLFVISQRLSQRNNVASVPDWTQLKPVMGVGPDGNPLCAHNYRNQIAIYRCDQP